jgi:hypothetical protein
MLSTNAALRESARKIDFDEDARTLAYAEEVYNEWEAYCQGSHLYVHRPKTAGPDLVVKVAEPDPVGSWDPLMAGAV